MSYDIINDGLNNLIRTLGYQSSRYSNMDSVPSSEVGKTFLLTAVSGQNDEKTSETLSSLVYDLQIWELQIAFQKSNENQEVNFDSIQRAKDLLIKTIDAPANWESYARTQKYLNWKVEERKNYYLLTMQIKIADTIIY